MKFYNRTNEIAQLQRLSERAYKGTATMTLLVGRRRIGKTELLKQSFNQDQNFLYFFMGVFIVLLALGILASITGKFLSNFIGDYVFVFAGLVTLLAALQLLNILKCFRDCLPRKGLLNCARLLCR